MDLRANIIELLVLHTGKKPDRINSADIFRGNGYEGDDGDELIVAFSEAFDVDISTFNHVFHYIGDEPPGHRRVFPVDAEEKEIPFVPVSVDMLVHAAEQHKWHYPYPEHTIRITLRSRIFQAGLIALVSAGAIILLLMKYSNL
ncbi:MAG: hypothetical protein ACJAQV_000150 [Loktanella salsilacus]|jgi:hypothetical protein